MVLNRTTMKRPRTRIQNGFLLDKQEWVTQIHRALGKTKAEALISWAHAEKSIEHGPHGLIEYGIWIGGLNRHQWSPMAEAEWLQNRQELRSAHIFNDHNVNHPQCNQQ